MKHYDSIPRIQDDGTLQGDMVWGYNKLDGQNFCATYNVKKDKNKYKIGITYLKLNYICEELLN